MLTATAHTGSRSAKWDQAFHQCLEILRRSGEGELFCRSLEAAQLQSSQSQMLLQVSKAHFNFLALPSRSGKRFGLSQGPYRFADFLIPVTQDSARRA